MIGEVINFLKGKLEEELKAFQQNTVHLPEGGSGESLSFSEDGLYLVTVNLEQDETNRAANPYQRRVGNEVFAISPDIHLNVYLLVVASYNDHLGNLNALGKVISYFQQHRVFKVDIKELSNRVDNGSKPISEEQTIDKLHVDMITLPFAQQNEVWNALRTHYRPSILLKLRMVVFRQAVGEDQKQPMVENLEIGLQPPPRFWFERGASELKMSIQKDAVLHFLKEKKNRFSAGSKGNNLHLEITIPSAKTEVLEQPPKTNEAGSVTVQTGKVKDAIVTLDGARTTALEAFFSEASIPKGEIEVNVVEHTASPGKKVAVELHWIQPPKKASE